MNDKPLTVEEAAQILKISKYTLYELIKRGEIPAQRIGRQLRIHADVLDRYIGGGKSAFALSQPGMANDSAAGFSDSSELLIKSPALHEFRFVGSHDPVVELLIEFLMHSSPSVVCSPSYKGSMEGLIALYRRNADIVGIHLWDEKTNEYNLPFVRYVLPGESVTILNLVQRVQGWIVPPGNPMNLQAWEDIQKKGLRLINRQKGSGTRLRLDSFLRSSGISPARIEGYEQEETTHVGVACRVANGEFDAGIGVQAAAARMGLDFVPLFRERYDLVCLRETTETPEWQQIVSVLNSPAFHNAIQSQAGYDTSQTGQIIAQT